jgi:hypothetical protein
LRSSVARRGPQNVKIAEEYKVDYNFDLSIGGTDTMPTVWSSWHRRTVRTVHALRK